MAIVLPAAIVTAEQIFALVSAAGGAYEAIKKVAADVKALGHVTPEHRAAVHAALAPLADAAGWTPTTPTPQSAHQEEWHPQGE